MIWHFAALIFFAFVSATRSFDSLPVDVVERIVFPRLDADQIQDLASLYPHVDVLVNTRPYLQWILQNQQDSLHFAFTHPNNLNMNDKDRIAKWISIHHPDSIGALIRTAVDARNGQIVEFITTSTNIPHSLIQKALSSSLRKAYIYQRPQLESVYQWLHSIDPSISRRFQISPDHIRSTLIDAQAELRHRLEQDNLDNFIGQLPQTLPLRYLENMLTAAASRGEVNVCNALLDYGVEVGATGSRPILAAIESRQLDVIHLLLLNGALGFARNTQTILKRAAPVGPAVSEMLSQYNT